MTLSAALFTLGLNLPLPPSTSEDGVWGRGRSEEYPPFELALLSSVQMNHRKESGP